MILLIVPSRRRKLEGLCSGGDAMQRAGVEVIRSGADRQQEEDDEAQGAEFTPKAKKSAPPPDHPLDRSHCSSLIQFFPIFGVWKPGSSIGTLARSALFTIRYSLYIVRNCTCCASL